MKELSRVYPVLIEIPIAWGDMDAFQHVNNNIYLTAEPTPVSTSEYERFTSKKYVRELELGR